MNNYLINIIELVKHHKLPVWALAIKAEVRSIYEGIPIGSKEIALNNIDNNIIDRLTFIHRKTVTSGKNIHTTIEDNQMTVYSMTGKTPYLKIIFRPTEQKDIDPFNF